MDPVTVASLALGGIQTLAGLFKKNEPRPVKPRTTEATKEALRATRTQAQATTDTVLNQQLSEIGQNQAEGVSAVTRSFSNPSQVLSGITKLAGQSNRASNRAVADFGQRKFQYQGNYISALSQAAAEEEAAFNYNKAGKYEEDSATKSALIGSGISNIGNALHESALSKQNKLLAQYIYG